MHSTSSNDVSLGHTIRNTSQSDATLNHQQQVFVPDSADPANCSLPLPIIKPEQISESLTETDDLADVLPMTSLSSSSSSTSSILSDCLLPDVAGNDMLGLWATKMNSGGRIPDNGMTTMDGQNNNNNDLPQHGASVNQHTPKPVHTLSSSNNCIRRSPPPPNVTLNPEEYKRNLLPRGKLWKFFLWQIGVL